MTFLVGWAYQTGQLPSAVLEQYRANQQDFKLLAAYHRYKTEVEQREIDKAKEGKKPSGMSRPPRGFPS